MSEIANRCLQGATAAVVCSLALTGCLQPRVNKPVSEQNVQVRSDAIRRDGRTMIDAAVSAFTSNPDGWRISLSGESVTYKKAVYGHGGEQAGYTTFSIPVDRLSGDEILDPDPIDVSLVDVKKRLSDPGNTGNSYYFTILDGRQQGDAWDGFAQCGGIPTVPLNQPDMRFPEATGQAISDAEYNAVVDEGIKVQGELLAGTASNYRPRVCPQP